MFSIIHEVDLILPVTAAAEAAVTADYLIGRGVDPASIVENILKNNRILSVYCSSAAKAKRIVADLSRLNLPVGKIRTRIVKKENWIDAWKKDFKPFAISERFDVVPAWLKGKHRPRGGRLPIYIDTSVAFGTGLHETTQFMVRLIERRAGTFETFLDIGTGTGILAIAALHGGANRIEAIDIGKHAVEIARENLQRNGFSRFASSVRVKDIANFTAKTPFDFVAANLITHDLNANAQAILRLVKPGGYLAVSGVSIPHRNLFRQTFDRLPLKCVRILKGETWMAFLFKRGLGDGD